MSGMQILVSILIVMQVLFPLWEVFFVQTMKYVETPFWAGGLAFLSVYVLLVLIDNLIKRYFPTFWSTNMNWSNNGRI